MCRAKELTTGTHIRITGRRPCHLRSSAFTFVMVIWLTEDSYQIKMVMSFASAIFIGATIQHDNALQTLLHPGEWIQDKICISFDPVHEEIRVFRNGRPAHIPPLRTEFEEWYHFPSFLNHEMLDQCAWQREDTAAFLVPLVYPHNLYHTLYHAIPARDLFARIAKQLSPSIGKIDVIPMQMLGLESRRKHNMSLPPRVTKSHILMSQLQPSAWNYNFSRYVYNSPGWTLLLRSLGIKGDLSQRMKRTIDLISLGCRCYQTAFGGHADWTPKAVSEHTFGSAYQDLGGSTTAWLDGAITPLRIAAFRQSVAAAADLRSQTTLFSKINPRENKKQLTFILRHGSRSFINLGELFSYARERRALRSGVRFVYMESLSIAAQAELIMRSTALAGAHGAGLSWLIFLPSLAEPTCVFEIFPDTFPKQLGTIPRTMTPFFFDMFERWSSAAGAKYVRLFAKVLDQAVFLRDTILIGNASKLFDAFQLNCASLFS